MTLSARQIETIVARFEDALNRFKTEAVISLKNCFLERAMVEALKDLPVLFLDEIEKVCDFVEEVGQRRVPDLSALSRARPVPPVPERIQPRTQSVPSSFSGPSGLSGLSGLTGLTGLSETKVPAPRSMSVPSRPVPSRTVPRSRLSTFTEFPAQHPEYPYEKIIVDQNSYVLDNESLKVFARISRSSNTIKKLSNSHIEHCLEIGYPVIFPDELSTRVKTFLEKWHGRQYIGESRFIQTENQCIICMEEMAGEESENQSGILLYCGHRFHSACLTSWKSQCEANSTIPKCPTCKTHIW